MASDGPSLKDVDWLSTASDFVKFLTDMAKAMRPLIRAAFSSAVAFVAWAAAIVYMGKNPKALVAALERDAEGDPFLEHVVAGLKSHIAETAVDSQKV